MASNIKLTYNVDIVFCIDCTESMDNILNIVKERALSFYEDVQATMHDKGKEIDRLRVRLVAFRDYKAFSEEKSSS
ncbi:MAG: VWA domain-containing protein [Lachnospiraceae bacterium]|nr:VWA domain-containing protein [Lachnospiraceae bacterium]